MDCSSKVKPKQPRKAVHHLTLSTNPRATLPASRDLIKILIYKYMKLKKLTWADDIEPHSPCYTQDGGEIPSFWIDGMTVMDILSNQEIESGDKLWAFARVKITGDTATDDHIKRLFACKCVRDTPLGDGRGVVWDLLIDERSRKAVEVSERFARGEATQDELDAAKSAALDASWSASLARNAAAAAAADASADASASASLARNAAAAASADASAAAATARSAQVQFAIEILTAETAP